MLVDLKIHYIRTENDILKRFLHMFVRHPDFMVRVQHRTCTAPWKLRRLIHFQIRLRHVVAAALLAPNIPAYVEGTSTQVQVRGPYNLRHIPEHRTALVQAYIEDNVEKLLGVSSTCRRDPADWSLIKTAIVAELTSMRANIKDKVSRAKHDNAANIPEYCRYRSS